jgi:hypothetical protein
VIKFVCFYCRKRLKAPRKWAGKRGHCTRCQAALLVPVPEGQWGVPVPEKPLESVVRDVARRPVRRLGVSESQIAAGAVVLALLLGLMGYLLFGPPRQDGRAVLEETFRYVRTGRK